MNSCAQAAIIASNGKSPFTIVLPEKAPISIQEAAKELQLNIAQSTGAQLPIRSDGEVVSGPVISLGATKQAAGAKVNTNGIGDSGFRILTRGDSVYIIGPDTVARIFSGKYLDYEKYEEQPNTPGPQMTKDGGFSFGTANGVYTFLEDYLGVRWLMPGDLGRDVPKKGTFEIPEINRSETPQLIYRQLPLSAVYGLVTPAMESWGLRHKLGFSFRLNHDHNWLQTVPANVYDQHADWFPLVNGKRVRPATSYPARNYAKIETTNPGMIDYFAQKAIEALKNDPYANTFSLSPSDGRGWSESPQSKALYDPPPADSQFPSVTPLILKWYHDVSAAVAEEYPAGKLAGYIYVDYGQPPHKGSAKLPENFTPVIVGQCFGFSFFQEKARLEGERLIKEWTKAAPANWFYYGMPTWTRNSSGLLTTASPDNLNFIFKLLRENDIKGAYLYGDGSWSQTAMGNYIQAKMLWNPQLDANQLQREWLVRAYGPAAGVAMEKLYDRMNHGAFADYFRKNPTQHYNVREKMFRDYYGPNYAELEKLFLQAKSQPMTDVQKQRLQMIEDNLIVLQWRLRNAGLLPADFKSPLQRSNEQVTSLLQTENQDFAYFPKVFYRTNITPTKVESGKIAATQKPTVLPHTGRILLYAAKEGDIQLTFKDVQPGSTFLSYLVNAATTGRQLQSGIVYNGKNLVIKAKAGSAYYLTVTPQGIISPSVSWSVTARNAALARAAYQDKTVRLEGPASDVYAYAAPELLMTAVTDASGVTFRPQTHEEHIQSTFLRKYPNAKTVERLHDNWRFQTDTDKSGLAQGFASPQFNDQTWKIVTATDIWQNQGFPGYHGTAWYRRSFMAPQTGADDPQGVNKQRILLAFGAVDGDAVIYLNGQKIGQHLLGTSGAGWDEAFAIDVTKALKPGQNTVAVQVTKEVFSSGIYKGVSLLLEEN